MGPVEKRELEVKKAEFSLSCRPLPPWPLQALKGKAVTWRDDSGVQFLYLIPWALKRIHFARSVSILVREKGISLSLKVNILSVFLSVSLSDKYKFGQEVITVGAAANTQGESKGQYPDTEQAGLSLGMRKNSLFEREE